MSITKKSKKLTDNGPIIISLGGSIVAPESGLDLVFLKSFRALIIKEIKLGRRFVIVVGGGHLARSYVASARKLAKFSNVEGDWLGIAVTRLNATLLQALFSGLTHPELIIDPTKAIKSRYPLIIAAGYRPGWSTDYVAVLLAKNQKAQAIVNLSNIDYVYDKDPNKFPEASKIIEIAWPDYQKIINAKWRPGLNAPFDPVAARLARRLKLKVLIADGHNITNIGLIFKGCKFRGTTIA